MPWSELIRTSVTVPVASWEWEYLSKAYSTPSAGSNEDSIAEKAKFQTEWLTKLVVNSGPSSPCGPLVDTDVQ
ncbi:unnamed protein product [Protopolystoma xenopodis]|uniref:Uncharacterized protein n=1 Tax=Protopolystoma xenopodis TaxID=117903 RepID=A0A3S5BV44_9PLAT|nr:unnamed protein product [Protopolystoma xenopodis]